ncbi:MAG: hemerythrin domain-containing protein [Thermoplasmata archaeon]
MKGAEDLFTPIHKAIRSMIYSVGGRLQTNDFADVESSRPLLADLEHEFSTAISAGCILCIVHQHGTDEEAEVFPHVGKLGSELVQALITDHHDFTRRLISITKNSRELLALESPQDRIRAGVALNQEANDFFAAYFAHMNREEQRLVPLMREHFTDDQMRAMRGAIMGGLPPDRLAAILGWMFPALDVDELTGMVMGAKVGMPPEVFRRMAGLAEQRVPPERWQIVRGRVGI